MDIIELINALPECEVFGGLDMKIKGITAESKKVTEGFMFVAIAGRHDDAYKFIPSAIRSGATVVVGEREPTLLWLKKITYIKVENARESLGYLASRWYGDPSSKLKVIGITGTDGKTTTANLLWKMLNVSGKTAGLISTVGARIGNKIYDTGLHITNPEALELQKHLALMINADCEYAVIEVTSHGIDQHRNTGVIFDTALLTNISREHLDYHKDIKNYRGTKAKLFRDVRYAVLNRDDKVYNFFKKAAKGARIIPYTHRNKFAEASTLPGKYNLYNISAAVAVAKIYKCRDSDIRKAIKTFPDLPGRMQEIKEGQNFKVFVDFAHTPNALKNLLSSLRIVLPKGNELIVVFGCAGERDSGTRAPRGRIASRYAHKVIVTADDPRNESLNLIYRDVVSGVHPDNLHRIMRVDDRKKAIAVALTLANRNDIVVLAGKGHEKSLSIRGREIPWADVDVARDLLKGLTSLP